MIELVLWDMLFAALVSFGFAYASNPPARILFLSALLAAVGHGFRFVLLVLLSICLLQVSHAVPYPVWRAAADYFFLRAKGGFPADMIMGQETLAVSCPFSLYI